MVQASKSGVVRFAGQLAIFVAVLNAGCNLKFPGPKFNFDTPDAAILGSFAGSGALGFSGGAGSGPPPAGPSMSHPPQVISAPKSVKGSAPAGSCPAGRLAPDGTCHQRNGVAPQCPNGGSLCSTGKCCPAGFSCGASGGCERAPGGSTFSELALCAAGEIVTSEGSNCPALTPLNAIALHARCCPTGSTLHCLDANNPLSAVCTLTALAAAPSCPVGYLEYADGLTHASLCCPASGGPVQVTDGQCIFLHAEEPECNGAVDPATGTCCAGALASGQRCCAAGHLACGNGCCELGESCDKATSQCVAQQPAAAPSCPAAAPRDCSGSSGQCCPADTQCQPDGTCSCPASAPVDCGGFCAVSTQQCSCPSDHPDACGAECCLHGGCSAAGAPGAAASCGCPMGTTTCGDNCCPSGSSCVSGQCLACPADAPTACGNNCCPSGSTCNAGSCVPPAASQQSGASGAPASGAGGAQGSASGQACHAVPVSCSSCTVNACASGNASSPASCHTWYESSDGKKFECASCGDCSAAAQAAVLHCCPIHL